jgi:hypothetical protein
MMIKRCGDRDRHFQGRQADGSQLAPSIEPETGRGNRPLIKV